MKKVINFCFLQTLLFFRVHLNSFFFSVSFFSVKKKTVCLTLHLTNKKQRFGLTFEKFVLFKQKKKVLWLNLLKKLFFVFEMTANSFQKRNLFDGLKVKFFVILKFTYQTFVFRTTHLISNSKQNSGCVILFFFTKES